MQMQEGHMVALLVTVGVFPWGTMLHMMAMAYRRYISSACWCELVSCNINQAKFKALVQYFQVELKKCLILNPGSLHMNPQPPQPPAHFFCFYGCGKINSWRIQLSSPSILVIVWKSVEMKLGTYMKLSSRISIWFLIFKTQNC